VVLVAHVEKHRPCNPEHPGSLNLILAADQETAPRLGIDRRTVKEKVDRALLEEPTGGTGGRRQGRAVDPD
jgi:hypothetical protein